MIRISDKKVQNFETEHIQAVRKLAPECTVLLKSDGTLPLSGAGKLAAYGSGVRKTVRGGTGSGEVNVRHFVNIEEGLTNAGFTLTTKEWLDGYDAVWAQAREGFVNGIREEAKKLGVPAMMLGMGRTMREPDYSLPLDAEGDIAIYVLARNSGEGSDRKPEAGDINLTETEIRDILTLNEKYDKFVLVLNVGGMIDLEPVKEVKNILLLGQLGTPTGDVLADLLLGKAYPSGKMTMTWTGIEKYPSTEGFADPDDTCYKEGVYVGYRYFETVGEKTEYPFGYGLGYTTFALNAKEIFTDGETISVKTAVKNTGAHPGKEVVQIYVAAPAGKLDKPAKELKAFVKTKELEPGEEQEVTAEFAAASMASYDTERAAWVLEKGDYQILYGNCSEGTKLAGIVELDADAVTEKVKNICPGWGFEDWKPEEKTETAKEAAVRLHLHAENIQAKEVQYEGMPEEIPASEGCTWDQVMSGARTLDEFVGGLDEKQLAYLAIGYYPETEASDVVVGQAGASVAGAAGETTERLKDLGLGTISLADGPAGLRLTKEYHLLEDGKAKGVGHALESFMEMMEPEEQEQLKKQMEAAKNDDQSELYYQYCISIPIGTALAQSWNVELCEQCGDMVGKEMEIFGVEVWLAPALNIHRSPLCGRNFEYYSEDPLIAGKVAAAITKGVQKHRTCATTIKHFACNNQETNRYVSNSIVSERALREIYLKGFEICVKESQPHSLMTSYNLINGEHSCNSKDILTYVLRDEWGFEGFVMTDWLVTQDVMIQGIPHKHDPASAAGCVKAGNDLTMPGGPTDMADIINGLHMEDHPYHITKAELQLAAKRVLEAVKKLS